jgi:hypothetical protein
MRSIFIAFLLVLVCAFSALAQTNPVPVSQPFTVAWDANPTGENVTVYRCYVDKTKVGADIPVATRTCTVPGQTAGPHVVEISAVNTFGEGAKSPLTATAGTPPSAPPNLRLQTVTTATFEVAPDGSVTLLTSGATVTRLP